MSTWIKRTLAVVGVLLAAVIIFGVGFAFAQYQNVAAQGIPTFERGMMGGRGGYGPMHDYVEQALAEKLGLTEEEVETALANGTSMYQLVLDNGVAEADAATVLNEVHKTAFASAVTAGVMTQEQADAMLLRMSGNWENGTCPHGNGEGYGPGMMGGRGHGMMGGWGQQQQSNP